MAETTESEGKPMKAKDVKVGGWAMIRVKRHEPVGIDKKHLCFRTEDAVGYGEWLLMLDPEFAVCPPNLLALCKRLREHLWAIVGDVPDIMDDVERKDIEEEVLRDAEVLLGPVDTKKEGK